MVTLEKAGTLSNTVLRTFQSADFSAEACIQQQQQHPDAFLEFQLKEGNQANPAMVVQAKVSLYNPYVEEDAVLDSLPVGAYGSASFFGSHGSSFGMDINFKGGIKKTTQLATGFCNNNAYRIQAINISDQNGMSGDFASTVYYRKIAENVSSSAMQNKQHSITTQPTAL